MKKLTAIILLLFSTSMLFAQSPVGENGKQLNFGTGLSSWGLPLYIGMDFGVHQDITVGFNFSFRQQSGSGYRNNVTGLFGNANYHFNSILELPREWNVYAGLSLGYYIWGLDTNYIGKSASGIGLNGQVGGRYFFNDKWGINLELGGGNVAAGGRIGATLRL